MTTITPINFRGYGSESAGSIAYRNNNAPEVPTNENKVNFRGSGAETAGSIANKPLSQPETDTVQFRGSGAETAGSIAHTDKPTECPNCGTAVNFKGSDKKDSKTKTIIGIAGSLVGLTIATVIGLGYAHKSGAFKNLSDGWMKKALGWLETPASKCHGWCSFAKKTATGWWERFKGFFHKKD